MVRAADFRSKGREFESLVGRTFCLSKITFSNSTMSMCQMNKAFKPSRSNNICSGFGLNEIILASTIPDGRVIDKAFSSPNSISPNKRIVYVLIMVMGLLIPSLGLYLKFLFNL